MTSPLVSIVTICFNNPADLERTLRSLAEVDISVVEVIIVDGSTDLRCKEVVAANRQVVSRYLAGPDDGKYDAMNKGLAAADGSSILFINSGDELCDAVQFCEVIRRCATKLTTHVLYGDHRYSIDGAIVSCAAPVLSPENLRRGNLPSHQSILIPKVWYNQNHYDAKMHVAADTKLLRRAFTELPSEKVDAPIGLFSSGGVSNIPGSWSSVLNHYRESVSARELTARERASLLVRLVIRKLYKVILGQEALSRFHRTRAERLSAIVSRR